MQDLHCLLPEIEKLMRAAGARMLSVHNAPVHEKAGHSNFVTDADVAVQEFLRAGLQKVLPEAEFFAEEQENAALTDAFTWVVDPIDGTLNFMHARKMSAISVGLLHQKTPVLGAIYNPYWDEMYTAVTGEGAFCNGKAIHASDAPFEKAVTEMGTSPYNAEFVSATAYCFELFMREGGDIRRSGSAAIDFTSVACGRSDIFFEMVLSPWDYAAGSLIVREAGGVFGMPFLDAPDFGRPTCTLCANTGCYNKALQIVRDARRLIK